MISSLELARLCGVSQGTVDRAVHNRKGVSPETRGLILAAAAEHGYRPNPAAREMLTGRNPAVPALVPQLNSVFFMDLLTVVKDVLDKAGYKFSILPVADAREAVGVLQELTARKVRHALMIPPEDAMELPAALARDIRVVTLINDCAAGSAAFVSPDERRAGADAAAHLLRHGHRSVMHVTYTRESYPVRARWEGFAAAMAAAGVPCAVVRGFQDGPFLERLAACRATAVFCHNDWLALAVLRALERAGVGVPAQVSVLGVDSSPTFISLCPDISSMRYPFEWVAAGALAALRGEPLPPPPPFELLPRRT